MKKLFLGFVVGMMTSFFFFDGEDYEVIRVSPTETHIIAKNGFDLTGCGSTTGKGSDYVEHRTEFVRKDNLVKNLYWDIMARVQNVPSVHSFLGKIAHYMQPKNDKVILTHEANCDLDIVVKRYLDPFIVYTRTE